MSYVYTYIYTYSKTFYNKLYSKKFIELIYIKKKFYFIFEVMLSNNIKLTCQVKFVIL